MHLNKSAAEIKLPALEHNFHSFSCSPQLCGQETLVDGDYTDFVVTKKMGNSFMDLALLLLSDRVL